MKNEFHGLSALTPALSPRRGSAMSVPDNSTANFAFVTAVIAAVLVQTCCGVCALPLLGGEGRGEGELYLPIISFS